MSEKPPPPQVYPTAGGDAPYPSYPGQGGQPAPGGWGVEVQQPSGPGGYPQPPNPQPAVNPPQAGYPQNPQQGYPPQQPGMYPPQQQPGMYPQVQQPGMYPQMGPGGPAPQGAGWSHGPGNMPVAVNAPPGLEYLASVDQLLVKQKLEAFEAFTGFETNNKYEVMNTMGQRIFVAKEDTCCCTRCCCGANRPFDMKVKDNQGKEVMHLERPLRCSCCLCCCCLQKLVVEAPKGSVIGIVRQAWSCCHPKYKINNADDETMLRMKGPCFRCNICGDIEFEVTSPDETTRVGMVTKQWSGLAKEIFTDADNFGVNFPMDLDVKTKATTLGAVILIDFMYFEQDKGDVKKEAKQLTS